PTTYAHPDLEPVLRATHGVILYEDDALGAIETAPGFSSHEAEALRRALAGKESAEEASSRFLAACAAQGWSPSGAGELLAGLLKFRQYAYCKSHAAGLGHTAWHAAWLKAHHPIAFWLGVLNHHKGRFPRWWYVEQAKGAGVLVLGPDINRSEANW